jgi:hypothetical protein
MSGAILMTGKAAALAAPGNGGSDVTAGGVSLISWQRTRNTGHDYFIEDAFEDGGGTSSPVWARWLLREVPMGRDRLTHRLGGIAGVSVTPAAARAPTRVPVPATLSLLGPDLLGLALLHRRRA